MKILITGGEGFIGSALVRHLATNLQQKIINVDRIAADGMRPSDL